MSRFRLLHELATGADPKSVHVQGTSTTKNHSFDQLACRLHNAWVKANCRIGKGSAESFCNISAEVLSLHAVLKESEETLLVPPPQPASEARLRVILQGCTSVLNDLQALVNKYESLGSKSKLTWDRIRWCKEDIAEIRARLTSNVALLTAFIRYIIGSELAGSLIAYCRISNSQISVKIKLDKFVEDYRQGRRESTVISAQTVDSLNAEDKLTWRTIRKELEDIGITVAAFEANRDFILHWLSHAVETGAFEEQYAPRSGSESPLNSSFASNDNITELRAGVSDIDISTGVYDGIEHDDQNETSDQPPLSNADSETPSDLARLSPVTAGEVLSLIRLPQPTLRVSAVPSVICGRCGKSDIAYELHMHCIQCNSGNYDLCLPCWRRGRGCLNWYGFGQSAMARWNRKVDTCSSELPHFLTGHRYRRVTSHKPPKGQGIQGLIETSSPDLELQIGFFCSNCSAFAEFKLWVCDICNEGEWAYCDSCVRGGRCCTHPLLPVGFAPLENSASTSSITPLSSEKTQQVSPLELSVECDVCANSIPQYARLFHCPECNEGDSDVCYRCYYNLIKSGHIADVDGDQGWRLCLMGHRMMIIGYKDSSRGLRHVVLADLVGGHALKDPDSSRVPNRYPGVALDVKALWSYWPEEGHDDELSFPKGAEIRECENVNSYWFWGVYCGRKGLFPGNHVEEVQRAHQSLQTADSHVSSKALVVAKGKEEEMTIEEQIEFISPSHRSSDAYLTVI